MFRRNKIQNNVRKRPCRMAYREVAKILGKIEQLKLYSLKA
jgi:hypothetical protein